MITLEVLGTEWKPSDNPLYTNTKGFDAWLSKRFLRLFKEAIDRQLYRWQKLTPSYLKWKAKNKLSLDIWESTTEIKKSLRVKVRNRTHYYIGFDNRKKHKLSKQKLLVIAKVLEFGSVVKNIPPRPLFRPILWDMQKNLDSLYLEFSKGVLP